jgi:ribosomal protein S18 acetylase RimI-like enzyme
MRIRPADPRDHKAATALYYLLNPKAKCTPESFQAFLARKDQHVCLAEDQDGQVLGLIEWTVWPEVPAFPRRVCFIQNLVVFPEQRRQGVGTALLNHACTWSQEQGIPIVHVETDKEGNDTGQGFYARNGFQAKALGMYRML